MSTAVVSTSAALGRPFVFDAEPVPEAFPPSAPFEKGHPPQHATTDLSTDPRLAGITPASRLDARPTPEMASTGITALDTLTGGLPRGCLTEICGPASSGRTTVMLAALAAATRRGEFCVVVDASDALDPQSVADAGVELDRLLWVRCGDDRSPKSHAKQGRPVSRASLAREVGVASQVAFDFDRNTSRQPERRLEQVLRATDLLLESGGFGLIVLDLADLPMPTARRIPLTTWFRFRRAVEHTPTILLAIEQHPIAGSCSSLLLKLGSAGETLTVPDEPAAEERKKITLTTQTELDFPTPAHAQLLTGLPITVELLCSRLERKPARAASATFASTTAWAG
jgi:hypothetical protein